MDKPWLLQAYMYALTDDALCFIEKGSSIMDSTVPP